MTDETKKYLTWAVVLLVIGVAAYLLSGYYHTDTGRESAVDNELQHLRSEVGSLRNELATVKKGLADSRIEIANIRGEIGAARNIVVTVRDRIDQDTRDVEEVRRLTRENREIIERGESRAQSGGQPTKN